MPNKPDKFSQLNKQLANIIDWFETGTSDIETAIRKYEDAVKIIAKIEKYLKTAENRLKKIKINLD